VRTRASRSRLPQEISQRIAFCAEELWKYRDSRHDAGSPISRKLSKEKTPKSTSYRLAGETQLVSNK
jgi:hypothetical protein